MYLTKKATGIGCLRSSRQRIQTHIPPLFMGVSCWSHKKGSTSVYRSYAVYIYSNLGTIVCRYAGRNYSRSSRETWVCRNRCPRDNFDATMWVWSLSIDVVLIIVQAPSRSNSQRTHRQSCSLRYFLMPNHPPRIKKFHKQCINYYQL